MHQLVNKQNFDNIKMHGTNVKIFTDSLDKQIHYFFWLVPPNECR